MPRRSWPDIKAVKSVITRAWGDKTLNAEWYRAIFDFVFLSNNFCIVGKVILAFQGTPLLYLFWNTKTPTILLHFHLFDNIREVCSPCLLSGLYRSYITAISPWHLCLSNNNAAASSFAWKHTGQVNDAWLYLFALVTPVSQQQVPHLTNCLGREDMRSQSGATEDLWGDCV